MNDSVAIVTPPEEEPKKRPYFGPAPKPKNAAAFHQLRRSHHQHLTKSQRNAMKEVVTRDGNGPINHPYIWTLKFHGVIQRVYMNGEHEEDGRPKIEVVEQPETTNQLRARKRREKSNAATDKP